MCAESRNSYARLGNMYSYAKLKLSNVSDLIGYV